MKVFISYRRSDAAHATHAVRLFLSERLGSDNVFMDVKFPAGEAWQSSLGRFVADCDALVVVIGDKFVAARSVETQFALEDDAVRWEIEQFIAQHKPVFPLLVGRNAEMPSAASLPESLRPFANAQATYAAHQAFDFGLQVLLEAMHRRTGKREPSRPKARETRMLRNARVAFAAFGVLFCAAFCGFVIERIATSAGLHERVLLSQTAELAIALWRGAQFLVATCIFGYGPYAIFKLISIFRAELRRPIVTKMSIMLSANLWLLGSFACAFLLLSTIPDWRLRPIGTSLVEDLTAWQYVALASSLAAWATMVPVTAMIENWCERQALARGIAYLPVAGQALCICAGGCMWWSLVRSVPVQIADDEVALVGYLCLVPMASVLQGFFRNTLTLHFPLVTRTKIYEASWWCAWVLWFTATMALYGLSVARVLL